MNKTERTLDAKSKKQHYSMKKMENRTNTKHCLNFGGPEEQVVYVTLPIFKFVYNFPGFMGWINANVSKSGLHNFSGGGENSGNGHTICRSMH